MIAIRRGTTPLITIELPEEFDVESITTVWIYISQNEEVVIDKVTEDVEIAENTLSVALTQEETLSLEAGLAILQCRLLNDEDVAFASQASSVRVLDVKKGGVIE